MNAGSRPATSCSPRLPMRRSRRPATTSGWRVGACPSARTGGRSPSRWPTPSTTARCCSSARRPSTRRASSIRSPRSPPSPPRATSAATSTPAWVAWCCPISARLGIEVPPWNFSVDGVTSISVDLHKYAYTTKGASVLIHRNRTLREYQTFVTDNWLGGLYGSSGVLGSKGGGAMAAAWAVMQYLGDDGYLRLTESARRAALAFADGDRRPRLAYAARPARHHTRHVRLLRRGRVRRLRRRGRAVARGWYVDRQRLRRRCTAPSSPCTRG